MNTTSYNHNTLGTAERMLIPNLEFKILIEKIKEGDSAALDEALKKYTLDPTQLRLAEYFIQK